MPFYSTFVPLNKIHSMKKLSILMTLLLSLTFCKGPGSGPLVRESFDKSDNKQVMEGRQSSGPAQTAKINIKIEPDEECTKISELYANQKSFDGKVIKVKGFITKFSPEIMGKNWIHIQDGSEFDNKFDLTITTGTSVKVGDVRIFEGKIAIDKDFGYGYKYNVLMEDAVISK